MNKRLLLQEFEDNTTKTLAPVIPIRSVFKETHKQQEKELKMKAEKKISLFYTEPIFRPKEYDFL